MINTPRPSPISSAQESVDGDDLTNRRKMLKKKMKKSRTGLSSSHLHPSKKQKRSRATSTTGLPLSNVITGDSIVTPLSAVREEEPGSDDSFNHDDIITSSDSIPIVGSVERVAYDEIMRENNQSNDAPEDDHESSIDSFDQDDTVLSDTPIPLPGSVERVAFDARKRDEMMASESIGALLAELDGPQEARVPDDAMAIVPSNTGKCIGISNKFLMINTSDDNSSTSDGNIL